jgi:gas vesicle protein
MAHSHSITENKGQLATVVGLSALAGTLAGMLLAPKPGRQTRADLKRRALAARVKIKQVGDDTAETAGKAASRARQSLAKTKDEVIQKTDEPTQEVKSRLSDSKDAADHIRRHGEP